MPIHPELHATNRKSFHAMDPSDIAFWAYCTLVALELAFKDADVAMFRHGHDVISMATTRFPGNANVGAAAAAMAAAMGRLYCTSRNRKSRMPEISQVSTSVYPDIRYIRRESDFSAGATLETDLEAFKSTVDYLIVSLENAGLIL